MELVINDRLKRCLNPLTPEEYETLKDNIKKAGKVRDKIRYMVDEEGSNLIVDGFNRYEIACDVGAPFELEHLAELKTIEDAENWMRLNQYGRRNVDGVALTLLRAAIAGNMEGKISDIASELDVSTRTLFSDLEIASVLESMPEDIAERIKSHNLIATSTCVRRYGKLSEEEKHRACQQLRDNVDMVLKDAFPKQNQNELSEEDVEFLNETFNPRVNTMIATGQVKADVASVQKLRKLNEDKRQLVGTVIENDDASTLLAGIELVIEPEKKAKKSPGLDRERLLKGVDKLIKQVDDLAVTVGKAGETEHDKLVASLETLKQILETWACA